MALGSSLDFPVGGVFLNKSSEFPNIDEVFWGYRSIKQSVKLHRGLHTGGHTNGQSPNEF